MPTLTAGRPSMTKRTTPVDDTSLYRLLAWTSPGYPTGAFSYSHGLEWAVEAGAVTRLSELLDYIEATLSRGGGWVDAVLFAQTWRAATTIEASEAAPLSVAMNELDEVAELAAAFRGSPETALESQQQGAAFLQVTRRAWPHPLLESFAERWNGRPLSHCVAVALTCAAHEIALAPALQAYLHAFAANLVSAGARLIPLGQTDAQIAIAKLSKIIERVVERARNTGLDDLATAAPGLEFCSILHETQYTRLFRS